MLQYLHSLHLILYLMWDILNQVHMVSNSLSEKFQGCILWQATNISFIIHDSHNPLIW